MVSMVAAMVVLVTGESGVFDYRPKMVVGQSALWVLQTLTQESKYYLTLYSPPPLSLFSV